MPPPSAIPNEAGRLFLPASLLRSKIPIRSEDGRPANVRNLSYGSSGGFSTGGAAFAGSAPPLAAASLPTVKYLRIFSRRFAPSPRMASRSSTLLNAPYDLRICKIFSAVAGPMPGTCCNSSDVATLMFTGFAGGFFFPPGTASEQIRLSRSRGRENRNKKDCHAMADL
jgi:hypothetical protein